MSVLNQHFHSRDLTILGLKTRGTVPCCAIGMAVAQVSMDPREEVSQQTGCACLSESEILIVNHQPKKGRASGLDEMSPEMLKCGGGAKMWRRELVEDLS